MSFVVKSDFELRTQPRPGRHQCGCQARQHSLVRNCLNCGRIVCEQEGSGPCFTCGSLVCTREEREIINSNTKRGYELRRKLIGTDNACVERSDADVSSAQRQQAEAYREKLLAADLSQERTKVHDLESDYYSLEFNPYLSGEEREAIIRRKEELREMDAHNKKRFLLDLDIANKRAEERDQLSVQRVEDPIIQGILQSSKLRAEQPRFDNSYLPDSAEFAHDFTPKYEEARTSAGRVSDVAAKKRRHLCVLLGNEVAMKIVESDRRFGKSWERSCEQLLIAVPHVKGDASDTLQIIGRAHAEECMTREEFIEETPNVKLDCKSSHILVLRTGEMFDDAVKITRGYHVPNELFEVYEEEIPDISNSEAATFTINGFATINM